MYESNTEFAFEKEDCVTSIDMLGHIMKEFWKKQIKTKMIICKICGDNIKNNSNLISHPLKEHDAIKHKYVAVIQLQHFAMS